MRFIDARSVPGDVIEFVGFLKKKGIYAIYSGDFERHAPHGYLNRKGIWIVIDEQVYDVEMLISDSSYSVKNPLSEEDMKNILKNGKAEYSKLANKFICLSFLAFIIFLIIFLLYFRLNK
jgi:hypothetical protein